MYAGRPADDEFPEPELDDLPTFTTDKGALLTHQSAISTLAGFCQLIRVDEYTPLQKPEFVVSGAGVSWVAELQVPKTAALYEHHFVSSRLPTRRAAKQNAAFQACLALHAAGVLDDHLLPLRPSRSVDAKDADGNALDRSTVPAVVQLELLNPFGNVWNSAESFVFVFEIALETPIQLALICGAEADLPSTRTLYDPDGGALEVLLLSRRTLIWPGDVGREQCLAALEKLNRDLSRIVLNRRVGEERFYALWAPVDASGEIDWPRVTAPFAPVRTDQLAAGDIVALPQLRTTTRLGTFSRVRSDVTSGSPTSDIETSPSKKKQKLVERWWVDSLGVCCSRLTAEFTSTAQTTVIISERCTATLRAKSARPNRSLRWNRSSLSSTTPWCRQGSLLEHRHRMSRLRQLRRAVSFLSPCFGRHLYLSAFSGPSAMSPL